MGTDNQGTLLEILKAKDPPPADKLKEVAIAVDDHRMLAKMWILAGDPHVFAKSPMKYLIFKERIADEFEIGSEDVRIVGSAKLGYSLSRHNNRYGEPFAQESDVDVVMVSEQLFLEGSNELFSYLRTVGPKAEGPESNQGQGKSTVEVDVDKWQAIKNAIPNFAFGNFNPGLLPDDNQLKQRIFGRLKSTTGLFLALEPQVFVSKIRCRIFKSWRTVENYYANTLRELKQVEPDSETAED